MLFRSGEGCKAGLEGSEPLNSPVYLKILQAFRQLQKVPWYNLLIKICLNKVKRQVKTSLIEFRPETADIALLLPNALYYKQSPQPPSGLPHSIHTVP